MAMPMPSPAPNPSPSPAPPGFLAASGARRLGVVDVDRIPESHPVDVRQVDENPLRVQLLPDLDRRVRDVAQPGQEHAREAPPRDAQRQPGDDLPVLDLRF